MTAALGGRRGHEPPADATLADLDADGKAEVCVPYGDGRVVALGFG